MSDDLHNVERRRLKRSLRAGDELAFSPVDVLGRKRLSHTTVYRRGRYYVTLADGSSFGAFATLARAEHEGRIATAEAHAVGRGDEAAALRGRGSEAAAIAGAPSRRAAYGVR